MHGRYGKCIQNFGQKTCREDMGIDGRIMLKWILGKYSEEMWTRHIWLSIGTSGRLL
jgi:hypothetical protein